MIPDIQTSNDEGQTVQVNRVEPDNIVIVVVTNVVNFNIVCLSVVVDPGVVWSQLTLYHFLF